MKKLLLPIFVLFLLVLACEGPRQEQFWYTRYVLNTHPLKHFSGDSAKVFQDSLYAVLVKREEGLLDVFNSRGDSLVVGKNVYHVQVIKKDIFGNVVIPNFFLECAILYGDKVEVIFVSLDGAINAKGNLLEISHYDEQSQSYFFRNHTYRGRIKYDGQILVQTSNPDITYVYPMFASRYEYIATEVNGEKYSGTIDENGKPISKIFNH